MLMPYSIRIELSYDRRSWAASVTSFQLNEETGSEYEHEWFFTAADTAPEAVREAVRGWREKRQHRRC